jgi:hypothetical protein
MEAILVNMGLWSVVKIVVDGKGKKTVLMIAVEQLEKIAERDSAKMEEARAEFALACHHRITVA